MRSAKCRKLKMKSNHNSPFFVRCQRADPPMGHCLLHCLKSHQVLSQSPMMLWALLSSPTNTVSTWDQWPGRYKEADEVG